MRVLIAVALLMCGAAAGQQNEEQIVGAMQCQVHVFNGSFYEWKWLPCNGDVRIGIGNEWIYANWNEKVKPAKQEKAQPAVKITGSTSFDVPPKNGTSLMLTQPLPFDLPAKEIEGPHDAFYGRTFYHTCNGVAADWKQRVLLDSAGGKHHCYAFYLLDDAHKGAFIGGGAIK